VDGRGERRRRPTSGPSRGFAIHKPSSANKLSQMKTHAVASFHRLPENYNCAQAVLHGFQTMTSDTKIPVADLKPFGGGRAPGNECGRFTPRVLLRRNLPRLSGLLLKKPQDPRAAVS
jgi:hypothetical protein